MIPRGVVAVLGLAAVALVGCQSDSGSAARRPLLPTFRHPVARVFCNQGPENGPDVTVVLKPGQGAGALDYLVNRMFNECCEAVIARSPLPPTANGPQCVGTAMSGTPTTSTYTVEVGAKVTANDRAQVAAYLERSKVVESATVVAQ